MHCAETCATLSSGRATYRWPIVSSSPTHLKTLPSSLRTKRHVLKSEAKVSAIWPAVVGVAVSAFGLLAAGATTAFPLVLLSGLACSSATLLGYRRKRLRSKTQAGMAKELRDAAEKLISSE